MAENIEDPFIEAEVRRATAAYDGRVGAEVMQEIKRMLRLALSTHPVALELARRLRPREAVDKSATVATVRAADAEVAKREGRG